MKTTASILAIALCLAASAGAAQAQSLDNNQRNNATIKATLNATISGVSDDVAVTSAAIANSFSATGGTGSSLATLNNYQNFWGDARSDLSASISNVAILHWLAGYCHWRPSPAGCLGPQPYLRCIAVRLPAWPDLRG